jgi:hypothetical protein
MAAIVQAQANSILNATLGVASLTGAVAPMYIKLGTTVPTATVAMTELPNGGGYVTGGSAITFGSAGSGFSSGPTSNITWTNSSGSTWTIYGAELWDSAGVSLRWWFGEWSGAPINIANGNQFLLAINGAVASLS